MRRIFISHRRINGQVSSTTRMIVNLLRESLYNKVFLDVDENYATQFPNKLKKEIMECDICVLILPDDGDLSFLYDPKNWVRQEIRLALQENKPIIPIIIQRNYQWPTDLPEPVRGLSHNKEGVYGGLNISYFDTNHEKESIRSIKEIIQKTKPQNILNLIWGNTLIIISIVCLLLLGIGYWGYTAFYPYTESQANELFNKAGRQNANGYIEKAIKNYKKIADFLGEKRLYNDNYFISKFMYAELSRGNIAPEQSITQFKELINETQDHRTVRTIWEVNRKSMFMLGHLYNQSGNIDSCTYYFNEVKPYFEKINDWHITEINEVLNSHKDMNPTTDSQTQETTTEYKVQDTTPQAQVPQKTPATKDEESQLANIQDKNALYLEGRKAYENQNFNLAFQYFLKAAKKGQIDAQAMVGVCYARGEGVEMDYVEADRWFQTAAKFDSNIAQYNLGISYFNNKKYEEAVEWFLKAAQNRNPHRLAMKMLSTCYANGLGVEKNLTIADEWLKKAQE